MSSSFYHLYLHLHQLIFFTQEIVSDLSRSLTLFRNFHFISFRFVSFRFFSFRFVSFRFVSFRFVSFRYVSFRFVSFRFVSFRFLYLARSVNSSRCCLLSILQDLGLGSSWVTCIRKFDFSLENLTIARNDKLRISCMYGVVQVIDRRRQL